MMGFARAQPILWTMHASALRHERRQRCIEHISEADRIDIDAYRRIANISGPAEPRIPRCQRYVDVGILDPDMRVADIHDEIGQNLVAGAGGEPDTIIVGQERYP